MDPVSSSPQSIHSPYRRKSNKGKVLFWSIFSIGLFLTGIYILLSDGTGIEYYKHVDEVLVNPDNWQGKLLQVHGFVSPGSIQNIFDETKKQITYAFTIENCGKIIPVRFQGILPDTFKDNAEVVVKGKLILQNQATWHVESKEILGKCPSKYSEDEKHLKERTERCIHENKEST